MEPSAQDAGLLINCCSFLQLLSAPKLIFLRATGCVYNAREQLGKTGTASSAAEPKAWPWSGVGHAGAAGATGAGGPCAILLSASGTGAHPATSSHSHATSEELVSR